MEFIPLEKSSGNLPVFLPNLPIEDGLKSTDNRPIFWNNRLIAAAWKQVVSIDNLSTIQDNLSIQPGISGNHFIRIYTILKN